MDVVKNLSLEDTAAHMGLPSREVVRLAQRGEIVRFKKDDEYVYRVKIGPAQPAERSPIAFPTPKSSEPIVSPQDANGFIVLRQAHQNATALARQLQQDNSGLKEQLENLKVQNHRSLFRWKTAAVACTMTILLLGSSLLIGSNLYQGRGRDILEAQRALAATTDHLEFKMDTARQQAQSLQQQLDQAQSQNRAAQKQIDAERKKLDHANARIERISRAVLEMMRNQNNRSDSSLL